MMCRMNVKNSFFRKIRSLLVHFFRFLFWLPQLSGKDPLRRMPRSRFAYASNKFQLGYFIVKHRIFVKQSIIKHQK